MLECKHINIAELTDTNAIVQVADCINAEYLTCDFVLKLDAPLAKYQLQTLSRLAFRLSNDYLVWASVTIVADMLLDGGVDADGCTMQNWLDCEIKRSLGHLYATYGIKIAINILPIELSKLDKELKQQSAHIAHLLELRDKQGSDAELEAFDSLFNEDYEKFDKLIVQRDSLVEQIASQKERCMQFALPKYMHKLRLKDKAKQIAMLIALLLEWSSPSAPAKCKAYCVTALAMLTQQFRPEQYAEYRRRSPPII